MSAASKVEKEITESSNASLPELTSELEFSSSPFFFTYNPKKILTKIATTTTIIEKNV